MILPSLFYLCVCVWEDLFLPLVRKPGLAKTSLDHLPSPLSSSFTNWNQLVQHFYFNAFVLIRETDRQFGRSLIFCINFIPGALLSGINFHSCSNVAVHEEGDQLKITLCELLIVMVVMIMVIYISSKFKSTSIAKE